MYFGLNPIFISFFYCLQWLTLFFRSASFSSFFLVSLLSVWIRSYSFLSGVQPCTLLRLLCFLLLFLFCMLSGTPSCCVSLLFLPTTRLGLCSSLKVYQEQTWHTALIELILKQQPAWHVYDKTTDNSVHTQLRWTEMKWTFLKRKKNNPLPPPPPKNKNNKNKKTQINKQTKTENQKTNKINKRKTKNKTKQNKQTNKKTASSWNHHHSMTRSLLSSMHADHKQKKPKTKQNKKPRSQLSHSHAHYW